MWSARRVPTRYTADMGRSRRRRSVALSCIFASALVGCSLFVDTGGLNDGSSDASIDANGSADGGADGSSDTGNGVDASSDANVVGDGSSAYATAILADGPIAYFRLNETSGNTITSAVGSFTGSFTEGVALGTPSPVTREPGNLGATFSLDSGGGDSDLTLGDNFIFDGNQPFSVEMWVNATSINSNPRHTLSKADRDDTDTPTDGWNVCVANDPASVIWIERIAEGGSVIRSEEMSIVQGSVFYFVGVYDGANLIPYVNAVAGTTTSSTGTIVTNSTNAFMGSANGGVDEQHGFVGVLDEVAIYDKALTPAQITAHFNAGKP